MAPRWSSLISHVSYGAVVVCCAGINIDKLQIWSVPYAILLCRSIVGSIDCAMDKNSNTVGDAFDFVDKLTQLFVLPCFVGSQWTKTAYNHSAEIGLLHPGVSLIPFILYIGGKEDERMSSSLITLNLISGIAVGALQQNWWCVAASVLFGLSQGLIINARDLSSDYLSEGDAANFLLAAYTYLTVLAGAS